MTKTKVSTLEVEIKTKITVDQEDAEKALKIVEWYMNDHDGLNIVTTKSSCGSIKLSFSPNGNNTFTKEI